MKMQVKFVNPQHPAIRNLALELKNEEPIDSELRWIRDNINYGMMGCLDLELELNEPVGLRKDYEVLQTKEGICSSNSFLLASLLRNRMNPDKVKLVFVSVKESVYQRFLLGELTDPYDHVCVGIFNKDNVEILDPTRGQRNVAYKIYRLADDYTTFNNLWLQRNMGIISQLKSGWVSLASGRRNGKMLKVYGELDKNKFYRVYKLDYPSIGLVEGWDLILNPPKKISKEFVEIKNSRLAPLHESKVSKDIGDFFSEQAQDRTFVDKLKKRLGIRSSPSQPSPYT